MKFALLFVSFTLVTSINPEVPPRENERISLFDRQKQRMHDVRKGSAMTKQIDQKKKISTNSVVNEIFLNNPVKAEVESLFNTATGFFVETFYTGSNCGGVVFEASGVALNVCTKDSDFPGAKTASVDKEAFASYLWTSAGVVGDFLNVTFQSFADSACSSLLYTVNISNPAVCFDLNTTQYNDVQSEIYTITPQPPASFVTEGYIVSSQFLSGDCTGPYVFESGTSIGTCLPDQLLSQSYQMSVVSDTSTVVQQMITIYVDMTCGLVAGFEIGTPQPAGCTLETFQDFYFGNFNESSSIVFIPSMPVPVINTGFLLDTDFQTTDAATPCSFANSFGVFQTAFAVGVCTIDGPQLSSSYSIESTSAAGVVMTLNSYADASCDTVAYFFNNLYPSSCLSEDTTTTTFLSTTFSYSNNLTNTQKDFSQGSVEQM